jgi:hypothetical protein
LKPNRNAGVSKRAYGIQSDLDGVACKLLDVRNAFIRYRDQERSPVRLSWCCVVDRQLKAGILVESNRKLSQEKKPVGQNGKTKKAKDEKCR